MSAHGVHVLVDTRGTRQRKLRDVCRCVVLQGTCGLVNIPGDLTDHGTVARSVRDH